MIDSHDLPVGVLLAPIRRIADARGDLMEIFRASWATNVEPVQWNVVHSNTGTLRGVHVHVRHADYLVVISGRMLLGLKDIRSDSPTRGRATFVELTAGNPVGVTIPTGVCHGFYFPEPSVLVYSVTSYWSSDDELGCAWNAPELGLDWPVQNPVLSPRDRTAGSYQQMLDEYLAASALLADAHPA